jgi:MFS family permease
MSRLSGRGSVRVLAGARFASMTGSQAAQTALAYDVYQRTGSATWAGAVLVATAGAAGLAGPLSGWLGDRVERRRVMVVSELAAAAVWTAMLATATPAGAIVVALLGAAVNAPFRAASSAAVAGYAPPGNCPGRTA